MARIPEYTATVLLNRSNAGNIEASAAAFGGNAARGYEEKVRQIGQQRQKVQEFSDQVERQRQVSGQLKAQEKFNEFQRKKTLTWQELKNQRMTSPDGFGATADEWFRLEQNNIEDSLKAQEDDSPFDLSYFRQLMDRERTTDLQSNSDWENGMRVQNIAVGAERGIDEMNVNFSLNNPRLNDLPDQFNKMRDYVNKIGANTFSPEQNQKMFRYGADQATAATVNSMLEQDPRTLKNVMYYGKATKDQLIDMTMFDVEGGDKLVQEPDGTVSKFGIKSGANGMSEAQVRALTPDSARQFYNKYWDPRLDKYDEGFRAVAFDALVNHGNDKDTWSMIQKANGDPYSLIALRQQKYQGLVQTDPEKYQQYGRGWENRMRNLTNYVQSIDGGGRAFLQYASLMDPDMINRTRDAIPPAIAAKERQDKALQDQKIAEFNAVFKDDYDAAVKDLRPIAMDRLLTLKQMAVNTGDIESMQKVEALENQQTIINNLKGLDEKQLKREERAAQALVNKNSTPETRMVLDLIQRTQTKFAETASKEGVYAAMAQQGIIPQMQPVNFLDRNTSIKELNQRQYHGQNVMAKTGEIPNILSSDELKELSSLMKQMPPDDFSEIVENFDALDPAFKQKISEGMAKSATENPRLLAAVFNTDDKDARRMMLIGSKEAAKQPYSKEEMRSTIRASLDGVVFDQDFMAEVDEAVASYYNAEVASGIYKPDDPTVVDDNVVKKAIEKIYAPLADVGNNSVFTFKDRDTGKFVDEGELYDAFESITDEDLEKMFTTKPVDKNGRPITADHMRSYMKPLSVGTGKYGYYIDMGEAAFDPQTGDLYQIDGQTLLDHYRRKKK